MRKKGFTLVELLVVLIIIGLLVAVALPRAFEAVGSANRKACASNIRSIDSAIVTYRAEIGAWPPANTALRGAATGVENYLKGGVIPDCPANVAYATDAEGDEVDTTTHFAVWPDDTETQTPGHVGVNW